jgi:hypothetical protein
VIKIIKLVAGEITGCNKLNVYDFEICTVNMRTDKYVCPINFEIRNGVPGTQTLKVNLSLYVSKHRAMKTLVVVEV